MINQIKSSIRDVVSDAEVYIYNPDGEHFQAIVVAASFEGMSLVKQHQCVMKSLKSSFDTNEVHALSLKTFTPKHWEVARSGYNLNLLK